jgi:hypothetical protein
VVADRLRINAEPVLAIARENVERWGWTQRDPAEQPAYERDWLALLAGPVAKIIAVLEAPLDDERCVHLRSTQPFAGVLTVRERAAIRQGYSDILTARGYTHPIRPTAPTSGLSQ